MEDPAANAAAGEGGSGGARSSRPQIIQAGVDAPLHGPLLGCFRYSGFWWSRGMSLRSTPDPLMWPCAEESQPQTGEFGFVRGLVRRNAQIGATARQRG